MGRIEKTRENIFPIPSGVTVCRGYVYMNTSNATMHTSDGRTCSDHKKMCIGVTVVGPSGDWKKDRRMYANQNYREMQASLAKHLKDGETKDDHPEELSPGVRKLQKQTQAKKNTKGMYPRERGTCVSYGVYLAVHQLATDSGLMTDLEEAFGVDEALLILDAALYGISTNRRVYRNFPAYAWKHAIFSETAPGDSYIGSFLRRVPASRINRFRQLWEDRTIKQGEELYFCCDAAMTDQARTDYVIRGRDGIPVTFATFPEGMSDLYRASERADFINGLQRKGLPEKENTKDRGLFIFNRGTVSEENIAELDSQNLDFLLLLGRDIKISRQLIEENFKSLRSSRYFIDDENYSQGTVSGMTVTGYLYNDTKRVRYFHIIYDSELENNQKAFVMNKKAYLQNNLEKSIKEQRRYSKKDIRGFSEFFDLTTKSAPELQTEAIKQSGPVVITGYQINHEKLDHLLWQCGYIVLVSSCKMTAAEALIAYRKREMIEKSFMTPAGFLDLNCFGAGSSQAINGKSLIWFVAVTLQTLLFRATSSLREKARDKSLYHFIHHIQSGPG